MTKLNDKQTAILANAANYNHGSVLPLPETLQVKDGALNAVLRALQRREFIQRSAGDKWTITDAGRAAAPASPVTGTPEAADTGGGQPALFRPGTRQAQLLKVLQRDEGADIDEMMQLTGWQPHSIRAVLTGFRKRGIEVTRTKEGNGVSVYRAAAPATVDGATH